MAKVVASAVALLWIVELACGPAPKHPVPDPEESPPSRDEIQAEYREAARAAYARGVFLREQGDIAGAQQALGEAVRLAPSLAELRLAYASLLAEAGHLGEAKAFVHGAIERFGGSAQEYLLAARLELLEADGDAARAAADSALARDPGLTDAWLMRGRLLLEAGRTEEAFVSYQRADSLQPDHPPTLEGLAECARRLGRLDEAQRDLERALRLDPELPSAQRSLAGVYRQGGRAEDAKRLVLQSLAAAPDDPDRLEAAVETLIDSGDLEGAARLLRPYHARGALSPRLTYVYGRVLLQLDQLAAADSVLQPLAEIEGLHGIESLLGDIATRDERPADARVHYRKAIAQQPDDCVPLASLALLDIQSMKKPGAHADAAAIDSALSAAARVTGPENYRCNLLLGLAYLDQKRWADAIRHFDATYRLDPENHAVLFDLAMAHQELGEGDEALRLARELLQKAPADAAALNFVGYLLAERGQELAESESLIRKALAIEPANGYYVDSLGWVLYQKGDYARAAVELERAVRLTKQRDALILEHLGDAYVKLGRWRDARRIYSQSRTLDPTRSVLADKLADVEARMGKP